MIEFSETKYNKELDNAVKFLKNNFGHIEEIQKLLKQYNITENDASITLYKNNKKVVEFDKENFAESHIIEKLLAMIASEFNDNHEGEDNFYLYDDLRTAFDDTHTLEANYTDDINGRFRYVNDIQDSMFLSDQSMALLTNDVDFNSWYHERLKRLDINEFNKMVNREVGIDFIKEMKQQYNFTPDNKFLSEFINEFNFSDLQNEYDDYSVIDDINQYLYDNDLQYFIALYVTDDLTYHYITPAILSNNVFKYVCDETERQSQGFAFDIPLPEIELQNLADYIQKLHFERFDYGIANLIGVLTETNPEEIADTYECIQRRIYGN